MIRLNLAALGFAYSYAQISRQNRLDRDLERNDFFILVYNL